MPGMLELLGGALGCVCPHATLDTVLGTTADKKKAVTTTIIRFVISKSPSTVCSY
jgi:hypothetical protein